MPAYHSVTATCSILILGLIWAWPSTSQDDASNGTADNGQRTYIGEKKCRICHQVEAEHWDDTVHASVFKMNPRDELQATGCEACHGPGSAHFANATDPDTIIAFTRRSATAIARQNSVCMQCHVGGERFHWLGSMHESQDIGCSDCHNPMTRTSVRGLLREPTVNDTCFICHKAQRMQFRKRSHMPLLEGKMTCVDCHNPHGSPTDPLLRADSVNQLCYGCHAEKRGPFLWEHAPVTENCLNCHFPHGSNRENLLVTAPPFLCQECHAQVATLDHPTALFTRGNLVSGTQPDERLINRGCVNCHVRIHGSNHPSGARFHR